jgi:flagellar hook-basal body complex protein FliE
MAIKMIDPAQAASLYAKNAVVGKQAAGDDGISFSAFLKDKISDSIETMRTGEKMSAQAITGQADLADVVQAVTASEVVLQTAIALRDRMIAAYEDVMRMPI